MYQYQVSFGQAVNMALNKYCDFNGRASRSEYWFHLVLLHRRRHRRIYRRNSQHQLASLPLLSGTASPLVGSLCASPSRHRQIRMVDFPSAHSRCRLHHSDYLIRQGKSAA